MNNLRLSNPQPMNTLPSRGEVWVQSEVGYSEDSKETVVTKQHVVTTRTYMNETERGVTPVAWSYTVQASSDAYRPDSVVKSSVLRDPNTGKLILRSEFNQQQTDES